MYRKLSHFKKTVENQSFEENLKIIALSLYGILLLITLIYHEPWRDEADSWLVVRDIKFWGLFNHLRYTGHPSLWYLMLMPLAKAGLPYASMGILHAIIALYAAAVFLEKAPFPLVFRVSFIFTCFMLYDFAVIARNYSISLLLLFCVLWLHPDRLRRPIIYAILIFLLLHTNIMVTAAAGSLCLLFLIDLTKKYEAGKKILSNEWIALAIMAIGIVTFILQLNPPKDIQQNLGAMFRMNNWGNIIFTTSEAFFFRPYDLNLTTFVMVLFVIGVFLTATAYLIEIGGFLPFIFLASSWLWLSYIFCCKYLGAFRNHVFYLILTIAAIWLANQIRGKKQLSLYGRQCRDICIMLLLVSFFVHMRYSYTDIRNEAFSKFSGAGEMAKYIKQHHLEKEVIVVHGSLFYLSVLPYFKDLKVWYPFIRQWGTYFSWNFKDMDDQVHKQSDDVIEMAKRENYLSYFDRDHIYLLLQSPMPERDGLKFLKEARGWEESQWLYEWSGEHKVEKGANQGKKSTKIP